VETTFTEDVKDVLRAIGKGKREEGGDVSFGCGVMGI